MVVNHQSWEFHPRILRVRLSLKVSLSCIPSWHSWLLLIILKYHRSYHIIYRLYMAVIAHHWSSSGIQVLVLTVVILFSKIMGNKVNSYPFTLIGHETNDYWTINLKKRSFIDRLVKNLPLLHIQSWFPPWNQLDMLLVFRRIALKPFLPLWYFLLLIL